MTAPRKLLHFTLGPVQGFIADARRTRDLWAGSFLLSWLSGHAMAALQRAGGEIIFPKVDDDELFIAITAAQQGKPVSGVPFIGTLPNRFKADVTAVEGSAGELCRTAVVEAWKELGNTIYREFIEEEIEELGNDTRAIWDQQVKGFWDMSWVVGDDPGDGSDRTWLDQRKNWRTQYGGKQGAQGGDLCRLMGRYQEISGHHRIGSHSEQQAFWEKLSNTGGIGALDLKADDCLCAIALIKRLFPRLNDVAKVIGWKPGGDNVDVVHWPSVSYIAAVPWLRAAAEKLKNSEQSSYWKNADMSLACDFMGEASTKLFGLPENGFFKLDGHLLHQDGVAVWPIEDLRGNNDEERTEARAELLSGIKEIEKKVGAHASEFYAVLLMDGDNVGRLLKDGPDVVKRGLAQFTEQVKTYFAPRNNSSGVLIYAGGDDVLALLPVDTAIAAARDLRREYDRAFETERASPANSDYTMSAAIIYAQYKIPFRRVLSHAHHFLDEVAKSRNGRDSLAVAVAKPGGIAFSWVSAWGDDTAGPVATLADLGVMLNTNRHVSSSLFYNLKNRYGPLFDDRDQDRREQRELDELFGDHGLVRALIRAELSSSGKDAFDIDGAAGQLLTVGKPIVRSDGEAKPLETYDFDGGLIARFLSREGRWKLFSEGGHD